MTRTRFGRYASMGYAKGSTFEDLGAKEGSEGPRRAGVPGEGCRWIGIGVLHLVKSCHNLV
jgi:hypothetical protein